MKYRAGASRELQFEMDVDYLNHIRIATDIKTVFGIIKTVFSGKNVYKVENKNE